MLNEARVIFDVTAFVSPNRAKPGIPDASPREREVPEIPYPIRIPDPASSPKAPAPTAPEKPVETPRIPVPA